ncbi:hypothetical protein [Ornithinimicrobium cavernae]|uniref:hypothetical protein n=1 Tax=Ornithinimicrobium cavernae TaxID=2666047 RepID=UPI000D6855F1|nr:hypothetical protein [Ornithinimicrobium cavernae]
MSDPRQESRTPRPRFSLQRAKRRARRSATAQGVASAYGGVATRRMLRAAGLTSSDIRSEVEAGRWAVLGRHTLGITTSELAGQARAWWAVWESGPGAVLDGASALLAGGLTGWTVDHIDVTVPCRNRAHALPGVRVHRPRVVGPVMRGGLPRTSPAVAAVRAAEWARSDRQAATILAMAVQQRLLRTEDLLTRWREVRRSRRRHFLDTIIGDICDGAHSLGELDFARLCRIYHLPIPSRQVRRRLPDGSAYLDVYWDGPGLHVEIDGSGHWVGLAPVQDSLRQNEVALADDMTLRIPLLGLRTFEERFMDQVRRGLARRRLAS